MAATWWHRRWTRPRAVVLLVTLTALGQLVALADPAARRPILYGSVVVLDALGAAYSFSAARHSPYPRAWRLVAAARACAVAAFFTLLWYVETGAPAGYWTGITLRTMMFALLAAGTLASRLVEIRGRARWEFLAEIGMVVAAGSMLAWYFVLAPTFAGRPGWSELVPVLGYTAGDLLVLTAVGVLLLGGALPRLRHPTTPMVGGLVLLLAADLYWNAVGVHSGGQGDTWLLGCAMVGASLLLTVSPMAAGRGPLRARLTGRPAWSQRLIMGSLLAGAGLMIGVAVHEDDLFPWGGLVLCLLAMVAAVTARLTLSLRATRDLVGTDPLTGLANRTGLETAVAAAGRRGDGQALLLIDLDDFKLINDSYGHAAGDTMLVEFAHHLRAAVRTGDTCARIGGDEFAVLLLNATAPELVAQRILTACSDSPVRLGEDTVTVHTSIGLTDRRDGDTVQELMRRADLAMYAAKSAGTHSWMRHDASMVDRRAQDAALADELAGAAGRHELLVYLQPIVDLRTAGPAGYEALVRWQHPVRGLVPPLDFIPVAERTGLIGDIGLYVLREACEQIAAAPGEPYLSVNVSPRQLRSPTLVHDVLTVLHRSGLAPSRLVLEVTESAIVDEDNGIDVLHELRAHGIRIAIDDFGTGYSSLHYLTRLPVDILKIDKSFVAELDGSRTGAAITEAIIRLAQVLDLRTIAEGIENDRQAHELQAMGCHVGQGHLYAPPRPAAEALAAAGRLARSVPAG